MPLNQKLLFLVALGAITLNPLPAMAYIGPGAGLGAIAVTIALVMGVMLLAVGLIWYPLKRMLKGRKAAADTASDG